MIPHNDSSVAPRSNHFVRSSGSRLSSQAQPAGKMRVWGSSSRFLKPLPLPCSAGPADPGPYLRTLSCVLLKSGVKSIV